ncbi:MAG TPA: GSCFA domain-containing protein [Caulobacterales bacterium]|nr:GSCFA domain-containing protein [Vitreimonas sp.]HVY85337.1 GSCFA domain-containing protein [Caulobacterales bacterium]
MSIRISADEAFRQTMRNPGAKWPARQVEPSRLEPVCEPQSRPSFTLREGESIFTIGSCFARNIEWGLRTRGYIVPCLDFEAHPEEAWSGQAASGFLNKYTPASMLNEVRAAAERWGDAEQARFLVEEANDQVLDLQLHVGVPVSRARGLERRQQVSTLFRDGIAASRICIITLGLIEAWYDEESGVYLNETPSRPLVLKYPGRFSFERLSFASTKQCVREVVEGVRAMRGADLRLLLTVSPVPIQRTFTSEDVIVSNCHSKSVLRAAAGEIADEFEFVDYFPSYESVTLSDRALAWDDDLVHVTKEVVGRNVKRMLTDYTTP